PRPSGTTPARRGRHVGSNPSCRRTLPRLCIRTRPARREWRPRRVRRWASKLTRMSGELPKIISVDDHVVEPAHVWQTWLPEKYREQGPRVKRDKFAPFVHMPGARYTNDIDPDGEWGDYWVYEDRIIYVQKKFVAIPQEAISGTEDQPIFDRTKMQMVPSTYDDMIPGCYDRDARVADFQRNWMDGSLPFPTFPRFCGQTFKEGNDLQLGLACVEAYNDWMIEEWCEPRQGVNIPRCIIPSCH